MSMYELTLAAYESSTIKLEDLPPIRAVALSSGLSADLLVENPPTLFLQVDPLKWAKHKNVKQAWGKLRDKYQLDQHAWEKATWDFSVMTIGRDWSCVGSMSKARKLGWTEYADTGDELEDTFREVFSPAEWLRRDF
ncbi:NAD dependent epimerase/dehydratase family protein [Penicillium canescens]|uniref:NAD dependent epimerase/dehydratase family protein n=1 Tax=Penicillium canescens TaxID=5083 RepID=A0AAD6I6G5_PENCN|nr:NAD dependent epimerase/dehydratase family protein [Penicillium canescens]KAJ6034726.1 NAD dependent epimerase/dehydratase family protein [Penicillium canescens]KAJ6046389.1 NAD dependent epimerase/dehydratase family protein [Penicillium canescens]KAJ6053469.1 NAD dependent epimerase/dehydratase family protein [Penicillium canescens]KAJ6097572.1 NAD dependent epimerase/dehydratase family protein [Penicillium canescens]KAJ6165561.1 NAD dependent epimerase/dehydratase family protein [Penicill